MALTREQLADVSTDALKDMAIALTREVEQFRESNQQYRNMSDGHREEIRVKQAELVEWQEHWDCLNLHMSRRANDNSMCEQYDRAIEDWNSGCPDKFKLENRYGTRTRVQVEMILDFMLPSDQHEQAIRDAQRAMHTAATESLRESDVVRDITVNVGDRTDLLNND